MSILKRLEQEPYRLLSVRDETRGQSFEDVINTVREKILDDSPDLVTQARISKEKRLEVTNLIHKVIVSSELYVPKLTRQALAERITQEICGLGPLDDFLNDDSITEIMVNGAKEIYIERDGVLSKTKICFTDEKHLLEVINRIVQSVGRRIDTAMPYVDARLSDGSRINAIIPPLALNGPVLTIRRFPQPYTALGQLIENGTITEKTAKFLKKCIELKMDIVVSGGSGSGKTTTLNVLCNLMDAGERIIIIEDSSEISVNGHHVVHLESRQQNTEGKGNVSIRDLLRNALRMRPDRLVVGECRGKETFDLVTAMNTGHEGCCSTVHANSSKDCLERLLGMALMASEGVPAGILQSWIAIGVDVIVHQVKNQGGKREVSEISVVGRNSSGDLSAFPVYAGGLWETGFPDWFADKIGSLRAAELSSEVFGGC